MSGELLLSDFCAICHVNAIKYTCPRCGIHTCSLPCVKLHKTRAQCSGERNPAEYRKRNELATASSIDKDFNFITNVERSLTRADDGIHDRGIDLTPARIAKRNDALPKWEIEAAERKISLVKAPKGLARARQNKTQWVPQKKCILWTIEWVLSSDERMLVQCLESKTVRDAYLQVCNRKSVKRKRRDSRDKDDQVSKMKKSDSTTTPQRTDAIQTSAAPEEANGTFTAVSEVLTDVYFYLHRPQTPSTFKCLIPLDVNSLLRDCLDGRTLMEFPTIYVKTESPEQLSPPLISEDEYNTRHGADIPINVAAPLEEGEVEQSSQANMPTDVDSQKVLESLARDLAG